MLEAQLLLEVGENIEIILLFYRLEDAFVALTREDDFPRHKYVVWLSVEANQEE